MWWAIYIRLLFSCLLMCVLSVLMYTYLKRFHIEWYMMLVLNFEIITDYLRVIIHNQKTWNNAKIRTYHSENNFATIKIRFTSFNHQGRSIILYILKNTEAAHTYYNNMSTIFLYIGTLKYSWCWGLVECNIIYIKYFTSWNWHTMYINSYFTTQSLFWTHNSWFVLRWFGTKMYTNTSWHIEHSTYMIFSQPI